MISHHIRNRADVVVTSIPLFVVVDGIRETSHLYQKPAELLVVQDKTTMVIKQIIIPSYHGEWYFYAQPSPANLKIARMMDMTWNACIAVVGAEDVNAGYCEWKVAQPKHKRGALVWDVVGVVQQERQGIFLDEETVKERFADWLSGNSQFLEPRRWISCKADCVCS